MIVRNKTRYPTDEVRALVRFGTSEVDMRRVCVNVKNGRITTTIAGCGYDHVPSISNAPATAEYLITLRIGAPERFPVEHRYPGKEGPRWPVTLLRDWREGLVFIAAHEAKHIEQFRERLPRSEIACEHFAAFMVGRFRSERPLEEGAARKTGTN